MKKIKKIISYTVYWVLQCTWGFIMTFIGGCVAIGLMVTGHKPKTIGPSIYFEVGERWGGMELGGFFLCSETSKNSLKYHECGHGIQNLVWGPLMPFVISIPSAARYWLFKLKTPAKRAIYVASILFGSLALTTLLALFMSFTHVTWLVISCELLRLYFILLSLWLDIFQVPQFEKIAPDYDAVWFEKQASSWGMKIYEKKEG